MDSDFKQMKKGDKVSAKHLNALTRAAIDFRKQVPDLATGFVYQRVMYITSVLTEPSDAEDRTGATDDDDDSSYSSSSSHSHSSESPSSASSESVSSSSTTRTDRQVSKWYEALPMYYEHFTNTWKVDYAHIPYELDGGGSDGSFVVGDTCIAYWDVQRKAYVAYAPVPTAAGGGTLVLFELTTVDCDAGTATGTAVIAGCGVSVPAEEDDIIDPAGCNLRGAEDLLIGRKCWCTKVESSGCKYAIVSMCCIEEAC